MPTTRLDRRIEILSQGAASGIGDCLRYVADTFDQALVVAQQLSEDSEVNCDPTTRMPVTDSLVVAIYDRLNAEMMLRGIDAPNMPPRGTEERIHL